MADTKERILQAALELFARDGYEAVSVSDIATALGITKGALYKHYPSKRAIFDSIIARMEAQDARQARQHHLPEGTLNEAADAFRAATVEHILAFTLAMFRYWAEDAFAASFRRMLILEQFRNPEMGRLYQQYLVSGPLDYVTDLFSSMGLAQPREAALQFYAPLFLLLSVRDGGADRGDALFLLQSGLDAAGAWLNENLRRVSDPLPETTESEGEHHES